MVVWWLCWWWCCGGGVGQLLWKIIVSLRKMRWHVWKSTGQCLIKIIDFWSKIVISRLGGGEGTDKQTLTRINGLGGGGRGLIRGFGGERREREWGGRFGEKIMMGMIEGERGGKDELITCELSPEREESKILSKSTDPVDTEIVTISIEWWS